jgi:hypothetical protein
VAIAVLLLLHSPPDGVLLNDVVAPSQTVVAPLIAVGKEFTSTTVEVAQPVPESI